MAWSALLAWLLLAGLALCAAMASTARDAEASRAAMEVALKVAVDLDFSSYSRDDEFVVSVMTEEGVQICDGKLSKAMLQDITCSYDRGILTRGDNVFFITIYSSKRKEVVMQTTSHFHYDGEVESIDEGAALRLTQLAQDPLVVSATAASVGIGGVVWWRLRPRTRKPKGWFERPSKRSHAPSFFASKPQAGPFSLATLKKHSFGLVSAVAVASGGVLLLLSGADITKVDTSPAKSEPHFDGARAIACAPAPSPAVAAELPSAVADAAEQQRAFVASTRAMSSSLVLLTQAALLLLQRLLRARLQGAAMVPAQLAELFQPPPLRS